jgi:glucosamine--fructose-6-phosphate aminotransferase (isomerizing)
MCGIVGYTGYRLATPILLDGLKKLEYRGYDSSGIAMIENDRIFLCKKQGKLDILRDELKDKETTATSGIGHTRWATHGRPSDVNAHPHLDCQGKFAVVHNGIIENYIQLKNWLSSQGHEFHSETDTEVIPHLIEELYEGDLLEAIIKSIKKIEGSYAMVVLDVDNPGQIIAVRQDSPLVVGIGEGENFLASDIPALLSHTRNTYILEDGEIAVLTPDGVTVMDSDGQAISKEIYYVNWEAAQAEKGGYDHFMLKEIYEQPTALKDTLSGRLDFENNRVVLNELKMTQAEIGNIKKIFISACGTAYHAGLVGKHIIEKLARISVEIDVASEFRYRDPLVDKDSLVIVISQSGETADTLAALRESKRRGARVLAITNVVDSSIAREADDIIYTWAGPEIAVASTKAYTTQLMCMYLIGIYLADIKGTLSDKEKSELIGAIRDLSGKVQDIIDNCQEVEVFAQKYSKSENAFFIGRGLDNNVAMEGALKLKEISYIHAESYAAGELKHGTLALIIKGVPVIALATQSSLFDKMISNIKEVKAREASVFAFVMEGFSDIEQVADYVMYLPETHQLLAPVLSVIPLQLLAYHMAVARGCDVDQPRNLAKSVTVE